MNRPLSNAWDSRGMEVFENGTPTTLGITSPDLSTVTLSPIVILSLLISFSLCSVAFLMMTPPEIRLGYMREDI